MPPFPKNSGEISALEEVCTVSSNPHMRIVAVFTVNISLQQTKQGQKNKFLCKNNHFEPMFINTIIWFIYAKTLAVPNDHTSL